MNHNNNENMSTKEQSKSREIWLDNLRIIAIICVVIIHVSRLPNDHFDYFAQIYQSSVRFCVPLFVMITSHRYSNLCYIGFINFLCLNDFVEK